MNKINVLKQKKTIRELEDELEHLKDELEQANNKAELEAIKQQQEQELELMRFKLDREVDSRKKAEEAIQAFKDENKRLNDQFEDAERQRAKKDAARKKLEEEVADLQDKLDKEKKNSEKNVQKAKEAATKAASQTVAKTSDPSELKALSSENSELKTKVQQLQDQVSNLEKSKKKAEDESQEFKGQLEDEVVSREKSTKAKRQLED